MKRVFLIALAFLIALSQITVYGDEKTANDVLIDENAEGLLEALGITDAANLEPESIVTREKLAGFTVKLLNISSAASGKTYFVDVAKESENFAAINTLAELGYMTGYGTEFKPQKEVTLNETVKVILSACGYIELAEGSGGYISGYFKYASAYGLLNKVKLSGNDGVTYADMVRILYNALFMPKVTVLSISGVTKYEIDREKTVLNENFNVYEKQGVVTSTAKRSVNKLSAGLGDGGVIIDDTAFNDVSCLAEKYLGYKVTYFYEDDEAEPKNIVFMQAFKKCTSISVSVSDVVYSDGELKYYGENDDENELTVSDYAVGVYNNAPENVSAIFSRLKNGGDGIITLIDHEDDGVYDVVFLELMEFMWAKRVDLEKRVVYNEAEQGPASVTLDRDEKYSYVTKNNIVSDISKIANYDAIAVIKNEKTKFVKLDVSNERFIGKIETYESETGKITVLGKEYLIPKAGINIEIKAGLSGIFYVTTGGYVVNITPTDGVEATYGYVISSDILKGINKTAAFKMLLMSGEKKVFNAAENCTVDGEKIKESEKLIKKVGARTLVKYGLNSKGEINKIELPKGVGSGGYDEDNFTMDRRASLIARLTSPVSLGMDGANNTDNGARGTEYFVTSRVVILKVPSDSQDVDEANYTTVSSSYFAADEAYQMEIYDSDKYKIPKVIVVEADSIQNPDETTALFVFDRLYEEAGDNGEILSKIKGYSAKKEVSYTITDKIKSKFYQNGEFLFERGDLLQIQASNDGDILGINYCFFKDMKKEYSIWPYGGRSSGGTLEMPKEYEAGTTGIRIADDRYLIFGKAQNVNLNESVFSVYVPKFDIIHSFSMSKANVHVVDMDKKTVRAGTMDDIVDGDSIFVRSRRQDVGDIVVYKNWK